MCSKCSSDEWLKLCEVVGFWEVAVVWVVCGSFRFWGVILNSTEGGIWFSWISLMGGLECTKGLAGSL